MQTVAVWIAVLFGLIAVVVWMAYSLGKRTVQMNTSEKMNKERAKDAEIAAQPDIDYPAAAMRRLRRKG